MPPPSRPDVVIIQADQLRYDCLAVTGNPDVQTPNLDTLAADAVSFDRAFCPYPVCTPSRYSMLSGLYPHQHRGLNNHTTLSADIDTFPRALRRIGYHTTAIGKMHFTPAYLDVGYQTMILAEQHGVGRYQDDYHRELRAAGLAPIADLVDQEAGFRELAPASYWKSFGTGRSDLPERWHSTTWIGNHAVRAVSGWAPDRPELLHVSFVKPHHPFDPPSGWDDHYRPDDLSLLPGWTESVPAADRSWRHAYFDNDSLDPANLRTVMAGYYATISHLDHHVGRILSALRKAGRYDNSLIIFTADHGEYLGFHHLLLKDGPMYDPVLRVPMIIKLPKGAQSGTRSDVLASVIDVMPTVLSVCGADPAPAPESQEWVAAARSGLPGIDLSDPGSRRDHIFAMDRRRQLAYVARSDRYKLIMTAGGDQLFDLATDPYELTDRARDPAQAGIATALREVTVRWLQFDAPAIPFLDETATVINAANVPDPDPAALREHRDYFEQALRQALPT